MRVFLQLETRRSLRGERVRAAGLWRDEYRETAKLFFMVRVIVHTWAGGGKGGGRGERRPLGRGRGDIFDCPAAARHRLSTAL